MMGPGHPGASRVARWRSLRTRVVTLAALGPVLPLDPPVDRQSGEQEHLQLEHGQRRLLDELLIDAATLTAG